MVDRIEVLAAHRRPLHGDEVIDVRDLHDEALAKVMTNTILEKRLVIEPTGRRSENVERSKIGRERQRVAIAKISGIGLERQFWRSATERGTQVLENLGQSFEVPRVPRVTDVEIEGYQRGTKIAGRDSPDDDEAHIRDREAPKHL